MEWWIRILAGLLLVLTEIANPGGFYFIFFGIGAVIVACSRASALQGAAGANVGWTIFLRWSMRPKASGCTELARTQL